MLKKYLELLSQKKVLSQLEIASQLGVSLGLVAEMTGQLLRMGYLQVVGETGCTSTAETGCSDCATHNLCLGGAIQRGWALTTKGQRALSE
jgi:hypothetical protein